MSDEFNEYSYNLAMEFIQARNNEYYRLGDLVIIASLKELISVENTEDDIYNIHLNYGELMVGEIVSIECNSNDMPRNVEFYSQVYIKVKYPGSEQDKIKPNCLCVPHFDVINLTVLGESVGFSLFQATRDLPLEQVQSLDRNRMWPDQYADNAWWLVASPEDRKKIRMLQEKANTGSLAHLHEMENMFLLLNRELRFMVLQDRFNNVCTFYNFEAFSEECYQSKRHDRNNIHFNCTDEKSDDSISG